MKKPNYFKGILFGIGSTILIGIQPIIVKLLPPEIDAYLFATMTVFYETIIFLPLFFLERRGLNLNSKQDLSKLVELNILKKGWKNNKYFLIYIGINFAIAQILLYLAYQISGPINASLAQKTTIIFGLLFGFLINHEKISLTQVIFSIILLFGLTLTVTQGNFNIIEFNIGVLIMLLTAAIWMLAHTFTKPILERKELTSIQLVFIRNLLSFVVLISTYFIFFPIQNIRLIFDPIYQFYFISMGFAYGFDLFFWYKAISYINVSTATIIISPSPIITALFAILLLGEKFTIFHLLGTLIIIISIIVIVKEKGK
ncbi:MAG: DMT family transporter [Candidatus Hermodarchaeota archaeon]